MAYMLKVRLQRVGRKNDPSFRLVVVESTKAPKTGNYIEMLGSYNPRQKKNTVIEADRVKHWIAQGAQLSDTVHNLLINEKVIEGKKVNPLGKKTPILKDSGDDDASTEKKSEEKTEAAAEDVAAAEEATESALEKEEAADEKPAEEPKAEKEKKEEPADEPKEETAEEDKKEETA